MDFREYFSKFIVYLQATLAVAVDQMIECMRFLMLSHGPPFFKPEALPILFFLQSMVGLPLIVQRCHLAKMFCTKCVFVCIDFLDFLTTTGTFSQCLLQ